jgi:hypothetical protein
MNVKLLAATGSALLVQNGALLSSHNCFITFLAVVQQSNVKLTQVCRAQAGRQVISAVLAPPQREF